ncbi:MULTISPECIES: enoyl-ACP reductase FabV [unclassified Paenibacillus]|uniref:enoyl-ACP reductase FabV n=1 Tax=unclassified Paenibacillus TaxID=185978 RepID=UPI0009540E23|nr:MULTISPECIES: enoyl-ACP reductase FabV [unclassified Paenibacillus]ASS64819.1 trans-2-enoyl-CoA reductase family protein [Paenibacillus sp. RUD330]SIR04996.1 enoyl-[acyl-carrier protein] reductase / trans-2-enoyl-CoA reductase (NAD+) [Paenibacillus sp. RU4X]SIR30332.1 enoyl-[acyl-carrier protein] reductase / trans-2-enoyl-CoA reductase (NAD+) [Paenibacillus sp. RU4T]
MIIKPRTRGFICTTAHPEGCAKQVQEQIDYIKSQPRWEGPKRVLVLGASTGYGLSARIAAAFGAGADTIGVFRPSAATDKRTASAGWYNSAAFEREAAAAGLKSISVTGDAFTDETKDRVLDVVAKEFGQVDLVVYSVAAPRRTDPDTGETFNSVLKPIGAPYSNKTVNFHTGEVTDVTIEPAEGDDIAQTVAVMGGADWQRWIDRLQGAGLLAEGAATIAYSYIGSEITQAIYRDGTIGQAKDDLEATALRLGDQLSPIGGRAYVSVSKALVTQSSSAIPVVPLYVSALYKIMKEKGLHENTIQQSHRLFADRLYHPAGTPVDEKGRIRIDDWELRADVQEEVDAVWNRVDTDSIYSLTDLEGYRREFFQLFGFETEGVDYDREVDPQVEIPGAR